MAAVVVVLVASVGVVQVAAIPIVCLYARTTFRRNIIIIIPYYCRNLFIAMPTMAVLCIRIWQWTENWVNVGVIANCKPNVTTIHRDNLKWPYFLTETHTHAQATLNGITVFGPAHIQLNPKSFSSVDAWHLSTICLSFALMWQRITANSSAIPCDECTFSALQLN